MIMDKQVEPSEFGAESLAVRSAQSIVRHGLKLLNQFEVSASYALGGLAGGQDEARMGWLYEEFAKLTLKELTGDDRD
ncbi:MAG: hypothetical protein HYY78_17500 [Betaproteobacteria bacterium]|nr:hypothetical protein [Betaproteobacteria bacterium]